ncbi:N-acetylmuramoyl-L-alanine amidase [Terriglobus roseus DSM 18391]|uniref:N-acetylmuramoyl-L-alanine amidase n=1 Tax=Terriglobus roseus (strain DSM 18391 / NRRL B-41598 / KBS 63) TaxID=926566 RepID=I3ZCK3_TERRK|nr:N-acetylmuramoyl-L-alanine amidase [Terriglobus roseus]AFL86971.1 N-acetylmuramoyl-L-alanine amidase [Terriglobus roseus DSM 18391]
MLLATLLPLAASCVIAQTSRSSRTTTRSAKKPVELTPWQIAEAARQQLFEIAPEQRTREDYSTVMDAYRMIYHGNPADLHAPESIYNVGLLLADEGTAVHDTRMLTASIGQFEFLRTQYPRSSFRIAALLEEAHVAADRMRDVKLARTKYGAFVEEYPQSSHIDEAQAALKSLRAGVLPAPLTAPAPVQTATSQLPAMPTTSRAASSTTGVNANAVPPEVHAEASLAASQGSASQPIVVASPVATSAKRTGAPVQDASANVPAHTKSGLATVSAIRHWSTPTYTRVAIDLGDEVQYEAARVPGPDRIYFDLHGTRLAQELSGKSFTVTDDGFLKRIRAAQYSNDMTRIVLDVNDVTEYSAFLLPNPYRLIIDIHGGAKSSATDAPAATASQQTTASRRMNGTDMLRSPSVIQGSVDRVGGGAVMSSSGNYLPPAPVPQDTSAVPSTVASRTTSGREVAALSNQPDNQRATAQPTSQPIAVISDLPRAPAPPLINKKGKRGNDAPTIAATPGHVAAPTSDGERTLQRALGLKIGRIVIDAGHGGHDSGTIGAGGIMEKDVVLDVALRLGKLLQDKLGAQVIYTRSDDTFIPLETRTAIANKAEADLFISVHANSSQDETARGVETYYLNFTSQPDALDVAARENAVSDQSVHQLADLVKKITLKDKIDESREFASDVEQSLFEGLHKGNEGLKNRGVKKAPFVVLIGANMPSILTEISFVTNGRDAAQLRTPEYRERVAQSIFKGVAQYTSGLSGGGVRVASTAKQDSRGY